MFHHDGKLKKVRIEGGEPVTIADSVGAFDGRSWGDNDVIVFTRRGSLWLAPSGGGPPRELARADSARGILRFNWPSVLPSGRAVLATSFGPNPQLVVVTIPDGRVTSLGVDGSYAQYVSPGYLVYALSTASALFSVPFSLRRLAVTGQPVRLADGVVIGGGGRVTMSIASNGTMLYPTGEIPPLALVAVDRGGSERLLTQQFRNYISVRVSPDGRRLALGIDPSSLISAGDVGPQDAWTYDLASGSFARVTRDSSAAGPDWSPDQTRIYFASREVVAVGANVRPTAEIKWALSDGTANPTLLIKAADEVSSISVAAHASRLVATVGSPGHRQLWMMALDKPDSLRAIQVSAAEHWNPRLSPDGRLLAFVSNETGRPEVYLRELEGGGAQINVSLDVASQPAWSPDGRELFYRGASRMMVAAIAASPALRVTRRDTLFADSYFARGILTNYDVLPGGRELLMLRVQPANQKLVMVVNWTEELRRLMGEKK